MSPNSPNFTFNILIIYKENIDKDDGGSKDEIE